ncbi:acidic leucine-rich nuclear phosphoprotein 32 family member B-like isoform X2 [Paramacrobiotus metropolitanus]|uniref:acidic leucine-rich nuclear phosphoprotein 32 family member B-like isoform X2 n=1 Tax=Paramacrobiotus metropolitanus TaxID=2943436 RepID=UPI002445C97E|nr:acidic leucine-rich nuclear phosphoprotein 32 family member B-like isoform X2 [Paramacrobiotus metropolitanus]
MFRSPIYTTINMFAYLADQPDDAKTIILDEFPFSDFRDVPLLRFTNLRCLSANACGVKSVLGLPPLPNLTYLQLNDNQLGYNPDSPHFEVLATATPNLKRLTLANNGISSDDILKPLKDLPALHTVDLGYNSVNRTHHRQLYDAVPQVMHWDGDGGETDCDSDAEMSGSEKEEEADDASMADSDSTWLLSDDDVDHISDSASEPGMDASDHQDEDGDDVIMLD